MSTAKERANLISHIAASTGTSECAVAAGIESLHRRAERDRQPPATAEALKLLWAAKVWLGRNDAGPAIPNGEPPRPRDR